MFDLKLYSTENKINDINKTLSNETTLTGVWREETSILNPVFKISNITNIFNFNYAYIPIFNRYYFITDIQPQGIYYIITLKVDVLESWKTDILKDYQSITRQETAFNNFYIDSELPGRNGEILDVVKFPNSDFYTGGSDFGLNFVVSLNTISS